MSVCPILSRSDKRKLLLTLLGYTKPRLRMSQVFAPGPRLARQSIFSRLVNALPADASVSLLAARPGIKTASKSSSVPVQRRSVSVWVCMLSRHPILLRVDRGVLTCSLPQKRPRLEYELQLLLSGAERGHW